MQHKRSKKEIEYCKYLAKAIKFYLEKSEKSLNKAAFDSLLSPSTLCRIVNNLNTPTIVNLQKISYGLNISLSKIIQKCENYLPENFFIDD